MEQFIREIEAYSALAGPAPTTIIQRAVGASGTTWDRWKAGDSSPTVRTMDRVRAYMAAHAPACETAGGQT